MAYLRHAPFSLLERQFAEPAAPLEAIQTRPENAPLSSEE